MRSEASSPAPCPLALLSAGFVLGICAAQLLGTFASVFPIVAVAAGIISLALPLNVLRTLVMILAFAAAGAFAGDLAAAPPSPDSIKGLLESGALSEDTPVELEGVVKSGPEPLPQGAYFDLDSEKLSCRGAEYGTSGTVRVYVTTRDEIAHRGLEDLALRPGSVVRISSKLERKDRFRNPGGTHYADILDRKGLDATAALKSPLLAENIGYAGWKTSSVFSAARKRLLTTLLERIPPPSSGLIAASVFGNRTFVDERSGSSFREGGTYHLLVISGLHITFLGAAVLWLMSALPVPHLARYLAATICVWLFAGFSGFAVPVVRASLMFTFVAASRGSFVQSNGLNSLGACVLILLTFDPLSLFDPSFQLTVTSAAAIVGAAFPLVERLRAVGGWFPAPAHPFPPASPRPVRRFCEFLYWSDSSWKIRMSGNVWECNLFKSDLRPGWGGSVWQKATRAIVESVLVSVVVQIFLLPLVVVNFHRFVLAGSLLNLPAGVVLLAHNFIGLFGFAASSFSDSIASAFGDLASVLAAASLQVQDAVSAALGGSFRVPVYTGWKAAVYPIYLALVAAACLRAFSSAGQSAPVPSKRTSGACRALYASPLVLGALILFHPLSEPGADGRLRFDFLDVGQGDSIFVTFPDGSTMLVDGGGRPSFSGVEEAGFQPDRRGIGESVVSEFLWEKGYSSIDRLVVTHSDADHLDGLVDVARNLSAGAAYFGLGHGTGGSFPEFREQLKDKGVPLIPVSAGDRFEAGGATVEVLNPTGEESTENDGSVVLLISYGAKRFLLTGDIEGETEGLLQGILNGRRVDVVKVPHHGSRTSSTPDFVRMLSPAYAVISVGRHSRFGHPHKEVVRRWLTSGAGVLTTGDCGTISVLTDGSFLELTSFADSEAGREKHKTPGGFCVKTFERSFRSP